MEEMEAPSKRTEAQVWGGRESYSLSSAFVYTCGNEPSMLQGGHATCHPAGVTQDSHLRGPRSSLPPDSLAGQRTGDGLQA